jgi:hypothetical protein
MEMEDGGWKIGENKREVAVTTNSPWERFELSRGRRVREILHLLLNNTSHLELDWWDAEIA